MKFAFLMWKQRCDDIRQTHLLAAFCEKAEIQDNILVLENIPYAVHLMTPATPTALKIMSVGIKNYWRQRQVIRGDVLAIARLYKNERVFSKVGFDFQFDVMVNDPRFPSFFDGPSLTLMEEDWRQLFLPLPVPTNL